FRGLVDKYTWVDLGSSYVLSELQAAFLSGQLEARTAIQGRRRTIWERYEAELRGWAAANGARLPVVPADCEQAYHMSYVVLPSLDERTRLIEHLHRRGILAVFHYLPLNVSPMGLRHGGAAGQCPVTEDLSDRLLRLPFHTSLGDDEQDE